MKENYFSVAAISNSSLSYINPEEGGSPEKYFDFVQGNYKEKTTDSLEIGDLVHKLVLEKKEPIVLDQTPSDSVKTILDKALKIKESRESIDSIDFTSQSSTSIEGSKDYILIAAKEENYGGGKYKDDRIVNDMVKKGEDYWNFRMLNRNKDIIDPETFALLERIKANINHRSPIRELFEDTNEPDVEWFTEKEIFWEIPAEIAGEVRQLKAKSKLDKLRINHKTKKFSIRDLKTTGKSIQYFQNSFEFYRYYRQIAFYEDAVKYRLKEIGLDYEPEDHFIGVVETKGYNLVRKFKVSRKYVEKGREEYLKLIDRIAWHTQRNNWIFSIEEVENKHEFVLEPETEE